jgi:phenylacetate-coenzyme A ligase PaaK-like adenylate-forming protein
MGYASMVLQLAKEAEAGRLRIAPRLVNTTSEPLLPEMREAFAAVWGAPVLNGFGSTEGLMGGSCSAEEGIHLSDDLFVIELVDGAGRPVPTGARASKVYLTSLTNLAQPLIRYELTDEMVRLPDPCPCGMGLMRIADVEGRVDDAFAYANGPSVHPFTFRSQLGQAREIVEYQVRQTADGADVLVVAAAAAVDTAGLAERIRRALVDLGLERAVVTVRVIDALARQDTGKLRRFVPLPPATP